jgi:hypothetical protein
VKYDPRTIYPGVSSYPPQQSMGMGFNNYGQLPLGNFAQPIPSPTGLTATAPPPKQPPPISTIFKQPMGSIG